jgi:PAS domain S-box-containing protein
MEHHFSEHSIVKSVELASLIESSDDAIFTTGLDKAIFLWSRGAERVYGYKPSEIVGKELTTLFPKDQQDNITTCITAVMNGERFQNLEMLGLDRNNSLLIMLLALSPLRTDTEEIKGVMVVARYSPKQASKEEVVERLDPQAESRALVMETANRVALDVLAHRTGVEALRHIANAARTLSGARYAALGVAKLSGDGLSEFVTVGMTDAEEAKIGNRPRGTGILGLLLTRSEPLRINVLANDPSSVGFPPGHPPMDSFLGVPIRRGDIVIGSLYLTNKENGQPFTEADEVAVSALGAHAAVAIHNLFMLSQQQALVRGLIHAQEEERRAVAYDLHDGLTQYVMASHAHFETFRRAHLEGNSEKSERELKLGIKYLQDAVIESRRMINGLRSLALDDLGLAGALDQMLAEEKVRAGWSAADLIHNVEGRRFDSTLETAVYRVAQESLTNARKHAQSDKVRLILLLRTDDSTGMPQLTLEVRDWGKGFNTHQQVDGYEHLGLQSMNERVRLMNGVYELKSAPGEGTMVRATFPAIGPEPEATVRNTD